MEMSLWELLLLAVLLTLHLQNACCELIRGCDGRSCLTGNSEETLSDTDLENSITLVQCHAACLDEVSTAIANTKELEGFLS